MSATLLVLAAGMGSRFGGVKQIQPVGSHGEAILDYSVYDAKRAGFSRVVFVIRRDIEKDFREFISGRFNGMDVGLAFQDMTDIPEGFAVPPDRKKPWGTGQAILAARREVDDAFAVINADDFYGRDAYKVLSEHLSVTTADKPTYAMVGYRLDRTLSEHGTVSRGICSVDGQGKLVTVDEHTKIGRSGGSIISSRPDGTILQLTGSETVSMNLFGFTQAIFGQLDELFAGFLESRGTEPTSEFYIPMAVNSLVAERRADMSVLHSQAQWFGMTYREDIDSVKENIRRLEAAGEYPATLWT